MAIRPVAAVRTLVILEDGLLVNLASRPDFETEFPALVPLKGLSAAKAGCGRCSGRATTSHGAVFTAAKMALATMSDDKRRRLKEKLNAQQIRVTYRNGAKIIQHTF